MDFFLVLSLALSLAIALAYGARRIGLTTTVGYILGGLATRLLLHQEPGEPIDILAELGIILIAFEVGREVGTRGFTTIPVLIGIGELLVAFSLAYGLGKLLKLSLGDIAVLASIAFVSSTAISYKLMEERGYAHGLRTLVLGVMAVEDALAVALLSLVRGMRSAAGVIYAILWTGVAALIMAIVGFYVMRKVLSRIDAEAFGMATAIALGVVYATIATLAGLSPALGAFVAGLAFSAHPRVDEIATKLAPVRELFLIIFFISMGLSIPTTQISWHVLAIALALSGVVIFIRFTSFVAAAWMLVCGDLKSAFSTGFYVLTIGEFSLIIAYEAANLGVASGNMMITAALAVVLAAILASALTKNPEKYAAMLTRLVPPHVLNIGNTIFAKFRASIVSGVLPNLTPLIRRIFMHTAEVSAITLGVATLVYLTDLILPEYLRFVTYLSPLLASYPLYKLVKKVVRESRELVRELMGPTVAGDVVGLIGELLAIAFLALPAYLATTVLVGYLSDKIPLESLRISINLSPIILSAMLFLYGIYLLERMTKSQQRREASGA